MAGKRVIAIQSWGKHFLIRFSTFTLRVHFMLFGSYRINERRDSTPRVSLEFVNGELNLYACSVKYLDQAPEDVYDWRGDVLSPEWDPGAARAKLLAQPNMLVCDALLDQSIFAADRDSRLRSSRGQRKQPGTLTTAKDDRKRVAGHCPHHHTCKSVARRLRWFVWRYPGAVAINLSSTSGSAGLVR